jgi:flagellar hook-length control protein FliK
METLQSLRSLDVTGGSPGTGRSTTSNRASESFDDELIEARTAQRRSEASSERRVRPERKPEAAHDAQAQQADPETETVQREGVAADDSASASSATSGSEQRAAPTKSQPRQAPLAAAAPSAPAEDVEGAPDLSHPPGKLATSSPTAGAKVGSEVLAQTGAAPIPATSSPASPEPSSELSGTTGSQLQGEVEAAPAPDQGNDKASIDAKASLESAKPDANGSARSDARPAFEGQLAKATHDNPTSAAHEAPRAEAQRAHATEQAANLLRQVRLQLAPELRQATIQLEPAALGRLDIRIEVRRGRVRAELAVERRETLETLERHAPELRAALGSAGFQDAELALSLSQQRDPGRERAPARAPSAPFEGPPAQRSVPAALAARLARVGGVDTYA